MTRRKLMGVSLALFLAAIATYFSWLLRPHAPFRFLDGHHPVQDTSQTRSPEEDKCIIDASYAFPADFDAVNRAAQNELKELELVLAQDDYSFGWRAIQYKFKSSNGSETAAFNNRNRAANFMRRT